MTSAGFMPRTPASLVRTALPSSAIFSRSVREAEASGHLERVGARGGDAEPRLVVGDGPAAGVQDRAADGGLDDLLDVVAGGFLGVLVAVADLEVPEAAAEGAEKGQDKNLDDDEPDL